MCTRAVVSDVAGEGEFQFERRKFGAVASELRALAAWLKERDVRETVMESTAQYWKPVWHELEGQCKLFLAQAHSNRAPQGRKRDFADAERLLRRHVAGELILSFVPGPEQRLWRTTTRSRHQLTRDRVRIYSQIEALLEDARVKLSSIVSESPTAVAATGDENGSESGNLQLPGAIRGRLPSGAFEPARESGPDAACSCARHNGVSPLLTTGAEQKVSLSRIS
jgi:hypothetical protein